jgi:gluconokinase
MIILITGVAGAGKTTIGKRLAEELHWTFRDADEFHPPGNIETMRRGVPLEDVDRIEWLEAMRATVEGWLGTNHNAVLTCSCLKRAYRDRLLIDRAHMRLVYLKGSYDLIGDRISHRPDHFMKKELLKSQFDILEEPDDAVTIDVGESSEVIVRTIRKALQL